MTEVAIVYTELPDSREAGNELGAQIFQSMPEPPDAIVIFVSPAYEFAELEVASTAVEDALQQLNCPKVAAALFFDCVATRLRMGKEFGTELQAIQDRLGSTPYIGCNSHGQIARAEGQFSGFHNCTAVICLIPE